MSEYGFTLRLQHVLRVAIEEARARGHEYVGTEHQLLALLTDRDGMAGAIFDALRVDRAAMVAQVDAVVPRGANALDGDGTLPVTTRAKGVVELTMAASRELGHSYIGVEHLLLALVREGKGIGAQVLAQAGVTDAAVWRETHRLLGPSPEREATQ